MRSFLFEEMEPQDKLKEPPFDNNKINVSFSGGLTSGKMTHAIVEQFSDTHEIVITFANTGQEAEETLEFVHRCEVEFGWNVVWLEAKVDMTPGKGIDFKVVDYYTASRKGEPFEAVIKKYGIPNSNGPWCTQQLKTVPIKKYMQSIGWKWKEYTQAIGIRSDEIDRMNAKRKEYRFWYPMIGANWTREAVDAWWDRQPFTLGIPNYLGNCTWCYKKSIKKLKRIARERPDYFEFPKSMEEKYGDLKPNRDGNFFREGRHAADILAEARIEAAGDDTAGDCDQGCEVFGQYYDENDDNNIGD